MNNTQENHALVFGASGIVGWAFVNELLSDYPSPNSFSKVTAFTNRRLTPEQQAQWPASDKLHLVSGLDLINNDQPAVESALQSQVSSLGVVTTVYFCAYLFDADPARETEINIRMLQTTVQALESLCPRFRMLVLPTGIKAYGVHLQTAFPFSHALPLHETHPQLPEPHATNLFYTHQHALLRRLSAYKQWTYLDLRPDIVVGFVPNNNGHSLAQWIALYLSLYRYIYGEGAAVGFPGTWKSYSARAQDSSQDLIARFGIWASLRPGNEVGGESFNIADADAGKAAPWKDKWPVVCEWFGLRGVGPEEEGVGAGSKVDIVAFLREHVAERKTMEREFGLNSGHGTPEDGASLPHTPGFLQGGFDFDRPLDLGKAYQLWEDRKEERDIRGTWWTAFERYRKAKIIP
ncbi:SDR family oxidoreductase [Aspergillus homomorphus CBS 101889]|uniref:PRISE-like Rossmann-fold domain-containing protein n=1 Tax=Aspergillus homomorphus (strain CBS 101889) TaxID=1450537 RepID=A0A395HXX3_ASPHC|nr:hypothetical protein BO97DRAFT_389665 [Aspergillus homomorphus CBS 101889]RAL12647.1 hypothetical protein BO97DRAFT_389665 [Aspergillus homomorphus CBS 101889]